MDNLAQFEENFNSRIKKWVGWWVGGYLRPDQFLDHLTVIIIIIETRVRLIYICGKETNISVLRRHLFYLQSVKGKGKHTSALGDELARH